MLRRHGGGPAPQQALGRHRWNTAGPWAVGWGKGNPPVTIGVGGRPLRVVHVEGGEACRSPTHFAPTTMAFVEVLQEEPVMAGAEETGAEETGVPANEEEGGGSCLSAPR